MATIAHRAALGIRGRFGCDIWERWVNLGHHDQTDWLWKQYRGIDALNIRRELVGILHHEGIRRTIAADCCSTCETPIRSEV